MRISDKEQFSEENVFCLGGANTAYAQYFIGNSYLNPLTEAGKCPVFLANVTFEPGCRNNWHIHHAKSGGGQLLICTAGEGWYQEEGKPAVSLTPGTVITIPAEVKHWHGPKKTAGFPISRWKCPARRPPTSGVSRWMTRPTTRWRKEGEGCNTQNWEIPI